ncbi:phospholipid-transporting ATPase ABCA3 isoform X1 [Prionailurus iriomotensis]
MPVWATLAISIGGFLYFLTFFPYIFVTAMYQRLSLAEKLSFCLLSNIAVALGIEYICKMEMKPKPYWFGKASNIMKEEDSQISDVIRNVYFEDDPVGLVPGISIQYLYK